MNKYIYISSLLLFILYSCTGPASFKSYRSISNKKEELKYGIEFTFTNSEIGKAQQDVTSSTVNTDKSEHFQDLLIDTIYDNCDECKVEILTDKYDLNYGKVSYPDGWYFNITLDPGVIEVTAAPIPESKVSEYTQRLSQDLFKNTRKVGLNPSILTGGGHIHFGVREFFKNNPWLFRDFLVDMYNNSELAEGLLGGDPWNSPSLRSLPLEQKKNFLSLMNNFTSKPISIKSLAFKISENVYTKNKANWVPPQKYQGVNIQRVFDSNFADHERTVELRFFRPQQNVDQFILLTTLFKKRRDYLEREIKKGFPLKIDFREAFTSQDKFQKFISFVKSTGERPEDYFRLLPAEFQDLGFQYLMNKYPSDLDKRLTFIKHLSLDSSFDDEGKAIKALQILKDFQNEHPDYLTNNQGRFLDIIKSLQNYFKDKAGKSSDISLMLNEFAKRGNIPLQSSLPIPEPPKRSCLGWLKSLLIPSFRAN